MKSLLIFFVLLFLGAMFLIGEHPEYNPFITDPEVSTAQSMDDHIKASDEHQGEQ